MSLHALLVVGIGVGKVLAIIVLLMIIGCSEFGWDE